MHNKIKSFIFEEDYVNFFIMTTNLKIIDVCEFNDFNKVNQDTPPVLYRNIPGTVFRVYGKSNDDYELSLSGNSLTFASGCVLQFCGGILQDGTIIGEKMTILDASFGVLDNVKLSGTYTNDECDLSWWGCVPYDSNEVDNAAKIKNAIDSTIIRITVSAKYGISSPVDIGHHTHFIVGNSQMGHNQNGFVANANFPKISMKSINNVSYEVRGMFYYYNDQHPTMENLAIEAHGHADYAMEHIVGYASVDLKNIHISGANIAGILQYGCEHLRWEHVMVQTCGIGIFIASNRIVYTYETDPVTHEEIESGYDVFSNDGQFVSMDNMLNLISCRVLFCNYGFVIKGGTNTSLINCESAHNSVFGLYTQNSVQSIHNYYSEDDGNCDTWTFLGTVSESTDSYPYLTLHNLDGVPTIDGENCFNQVVCLRAPIFFDGSLVSIKGLFTSVYPRLASPGETEISLPTQRGDAGVDAFIIAKEGRVTVEGHHIYLLSSDAPELPMPFKTYIAMSRFIYSKPAIFDIRSFKTNGHDVSVWYANNSVYEGNYYSAYTGKVNQRSPSFVAGITRRNYNVMGGAVYGSIGSRYDIRRFASFREFYNGVPLFQLTETSKLLRYFTYSEVQNKFKDVSQVKLRLVMKIVSSQVMPFAISAWLQDSSYQTVYVAGATNSGVYGTLTEGYYDIFMRLDLSYISSWHHLVLSLNCSGSSDEIYFSEFLFYDNEDGQILPPPIYDSVRLISGSTAERPYLPIVGQLYFDTTLHKQIVYNGSAWVNVDGTSL